MKKFFFLLMAAGVIAGASSCKKCETCTKSGSPTITYCEKDYSTKADYDAAVSITEGLGYTCK